MIRYAKWAALPLLVALVVTGCPKEDQSRSARSGTGTSDTLTDYQRDSMLSTSTIPGARGVGAAMNAAGATNAGIHAADSVAP
jgi:hypothetical protein